jgi:hypothetical protein
MIKIEDCELESKESQDVRLQKLAKTRSLRVRDVKVIVRTVLTHFIGYCDNELLVHDYQVR